MRSDVASWVYVAGPRAYFAAAVAATTLVPVVFAAAPLESAGGILLLVGALALGASRSRRQRWTPAVHSVAWAQAVT